MGCLLVLVLLGSSGCQRLNHEATVQVEPTGVQSTIISAPRSDQKVAVDVSSPGAPVNVYVVLEKDEEAARDALGRQQKPANVLAGKEKVEQDTLETTIPAGKGFAVLLGSASNKTAQVKLKVTGR
jgi:hypothetical protein